MNKIAVFREKLRALFLSLSGSQKFYFAGMFLIPFVFIYSLLPIPLAAPSGMVGVLIFFTLGLFLDSIKIYKLLWTSTLGKPFLLVGYAMGVTFAYSTASQVLNYILGTNVSSLSYSLSFVALMLIPGLIMIGLGILFVGIFLFGQLYLIPRLIIHDLAKDEFFAKLFPPSIEPYPRTTLALRFVIAVIVIGVYLSFGGKSIPAYTSAVENNAKWFLYNFQAYPKSECIITEGVKVIYLSNKMIVKATYGKDGYVFLLDKCVEQAPNN